VSKSFRLLILSCILIFSVSLFPVTSAHALTFPAEINQSFAPIAIVSGATSVLTITIYNPNTNQLTAATWQDDMTLGGTQLGLSIASPLNVTSTCGSVTDVTAIGGGALASGGTTLQLNNGTVPAYDVIHGVPGSCYVQVTVTSTKPGNLINTIPAYGVAPLDGGQGLTATTLDSGTPVTIHNTTPASATLNVIPVQPPSLNKSFSPNTIAVGGTSTLTINVLNNDANNSLNQVTFFDVLPTAGNSDVVFTNSNPPTTSPTLTGCGSATLTDKDGNALVSGTSTSIKLNNATILKNSTCKITVVVTSSKQGAYTNTIPAGPASTNPGAVQTREGVTNASPASDQLNVQAFNLTKSFATSPIAPGSETQMTIAIQNIANMDYTGATLSDKLPAGLVYDPSGTLSNSCAVGNLAITTIAITNDTLKLTSGTIPAGSTCTITATVMAQMSAAEGTYTNQIPVGALTTNEGAKNEAEADSSLDVKSLWISKDFSPTTFAAGQTSTLTITIHNPSPNPFTNASLSDILPTSPNSDLEFTGTPTTNCNPAFPFPPSAIVSLSGSPTREVDLTGGYIPGGSLASPGTCFITSTVTTSANAPAADYTGANANTIPAGALKTTELGTNKSPATAPVSVTTISVGKAYSPTTVSYPNASKLTITITNPATGGALTGIGFTDTLNTALEIVDLTPPSTDPATTCRDIGNPANPVPTLTATVGTQTITLANGSLPAGPSSCTVTVYVRPKSTTSSGAFDNTLNPGDVTTTQGPKNSNTSTATLNVSSVGVSKAFTYSSFEAGATDTLTITLTNSTGSDLHITSANPFSDTLPTNPNNNLYFTGTPTTTCSSNPLDVSLTPTTRTVTLTNGTIPANKSCNIIATVTTDASALAADYIGADANTIPVGALVTTEGPSNTTAATAPVSVYANKAGVTATKTFTPPTIGPGGNSRLRLTFTAPPDTGLTNFGFTDTLPAGVTVSNSTPATDPGCGTLLNWPPATGATTINTETVPNTGTGTGTIAIDGMCTVNVYVTSNIGSGPGIQYKNTIHTTDITDTEIRSIPSDISATFTVQTPSTLTVTKAFYPTAVNPGGLSTLKITLTNTNANKLTNVTLDDLLPDSPTDGVIVAPASAGPGEPNASTTCTETGNAATITFPTSQTIQLNNGTILADKGGIPGICTINVDVQGTSTNGLNAVTHHNTIHTTDVTATINDGSGSTMNATSDAKADLTVGNLDLEVVKGFVPQLVYGGANSTMSIILRNPNTSTDLTGIQFTDNMFFAGTPPPPDYPEGEMILTDPPNFDPSACNPPSGPPAVMTAGTPDAKGYISSFTFSGGYLAAGAQCTITLDVTMTVNGNLTNTIPIGGVTSFNGAYNHTATAASLTNEAGASISKSFAPNPQSSGLNSYSILTLTIRNTTNVGLTGVGLVDDLPTTPAPGLQVAGGSAPAPVNGCGGTLSAAPGATVIQLSGGSLIVGFSSCTMTIPVTGAQPGTYTNTILPSQLTSDQKPDVRQEAVDTLTLTPYSLGNRVWYDTNDNGILDTGEVGVSGVTVKLYLDNGTTLGVWDSGDTLVGTQTTDANGYYRFDNLGAGNYIVVIPASNFNSSGAPLAGYLSSGTSLTGTTVSDTIAYNPNDTSPNTDNQDHGVSTFNGLAVNYVSSKVVTLGPGGNAPTGETDKPSPNPAGEAADNQSNLTVDFGFYRLQLGNQIFADINGKGNYDCGTDSPLPGATVELFASDNTTQINVGPDGILGTADDAPGGVISTSGSSCSNGGGNYLFSGLPAGNYIVKVLPTGYPSTVDTYNSADTANPNVNADNNDNGAGTGVGTVSSNIVTLTPGGGGANNLVTNSTGTTNNPTLDFGFVTSLGKKMVSTNLANTSGSNVAIGEIITYEVDMSIPANATFNNATLVDIPDSGLAFVHCISVSLPLAGVTINGFTTFTCNEGTTAGSNPLVSNSGGTVAFDFGTIKSISPTTQIIKVQYSMVVLDILANQNGDSLTNHAVWAWTGGTATTSAPPVKIVEPKMTISKSANPAIASYGSTVTFTIDIAHSAQSEEDALYEVVTDQIPTSLSFVTGSLTVTGTAPAPTSSNYDSATHTLTVNWNVFPLGKAAQISYQVVFLGPPPVVNAVSAEWTSLFIDPVPTPPQQSPYNTSSTQRWYAPSTSAGVDDYGSSSSATINSPSSHKAGSINESAFAGVEPVTPLTGFAPGQVTLLPAQPEDKAYQDLGNFWVEIPRLKVKIPIVGIPLNKDGSWDLTWLGDQAGYLDGTAYPTHDGNSVITAHVYMSNGLPGPFVNLHTLQWGDQIIIHFAGQRYIYEVQENNIVSPTDISAFKHEDQTWLTLITCKDYNARTSTYAHRVVVGAVLIKVQPDTGSNGK